MTLTNGSYLNDLHARKVLCDKWPGWQNNLRLSDSFVWEDVVEESCLAVILPSLGLLEILHLVFRSASWGKNCFYYSVAKKLNLHDCFVFCHEQAFSSSSFFFFFFSFFFFFFSFLCVLTVNMTKQQSRSIEKRGTNSARQTTDILQLKQRLRSESSTVTFTWHASIKIQGT